MGDGEKKEEGGKGMWRNKGKVRKNGIGRKKGRERKLGMWRKKGNR